MTTVEIPSQPLERDVARPPDPDANKAARQPDGVEATDAAVVVDSVQPTAGPQPAASGAGCVVSTTGDDGP